MRAVQLALESLTQMVGTQEVLYIILGGPKKNGPVDF